MPDSRSLRLGLLVGLLGVLFVLFVAYGAGVGVYDGLPYDEDAIAQNADTVLGEQVQVGGTVVGVDSVMIEVEYDEGTMVVVIENAPAVEVGQELIVSGVLVDERTVEADRERAVVRDAWETQYMYVISVVAALLVAARIGNEWRLSVREVMFEPRERTLYDQYVRGGGDG